MTHIAIIEDDRGLNTGIMLALKNNDYTFSQFYTLSEVTDLPSFDLIILDINLPDGNGLDFLRKVRSSSNVPVIILTANDHEMDEVMGLELGADDYITKPFSLMVLRVRVEKALHKTASSNANQIYQLDHFLFDFDQMRFYNNSEELELSKTEQRLLKVLVENRNITLSRSQLLNHVWGQGSEFVEENALSVTIKRLRDKLENDSSKPKYIHTVYGIGYVWKENTEE